MMYCSQCGEKNLDNANFCKKCGYNIRQMQTPNSNTYNQTNDIFSHSDKSVHSDINKSTILPNQSYKGKGKLLYSTKGKYSSIGIVIGIVLYIVGAICFYASFGNFSTSAPSPIIAFIPLCLFMMPLINAMNMKRSYVEIYENELIGFSLPKNSFNGKCGKFSLAYDKIISIEYQRDTVTFKFTSGEYTVQAKKCAHNVVNLCKQQMKRYR